MKETKLSERQRGALCVGFQDEEGAVRSSFISREIGGSAMRAVALAANEVQRGANGMHIVNTAAEQSLTSLGGAPDVARFFGKLVSGDRDLILLESRYQDEPESDLLLRCPVMVARGGQLQPCGEPLKAHVKWGDVTVREPEAGEVVWVLGFPCFRFSDPAAGIQSATIRFLTVPVEREAMEPERMKSAPIGPQHFLLSRTIVELNGTGILTQEDAARVGRPYLLTEDDIDALAKKKLAALNRAIEQHRVGPDLSARVAGKVCGHASNHVLEVVSHFLEPGA